MNTAVAVEDHVTGESPLSVGSYLRKKRNEKGLSQSQVADATGLSTPTIKNYESGRNLPPMDRAIKLGRVLGFDPKELMTEAMREMGEAMPGEIVGPDDDQPVMISRGALIELMNAVRAPDVLAERRQADQIAVPDAEPESDIDRAIMRLDRLSQVVAENGLKSRKLPRLVNDAMEVLDELELSELSEVAAEYQVPRACVLKAEAFEGMDDDMREGELDALSRIVIVAVIYGETFFEANVNRLRKLGRPLEKLRIKLTYEEPFLFDRDNELEVARKAMAIDLVTAISDEGRALDVESILAA